MGGVGGGGDADGWMGVGEREMYIDGIEGGEDVDGVGEIGG